MSKHTAGPWHADPPTKDWMDHHVVSASGHTVAVVFAPGGLEERRANAKLLAAALDLLEASESVLAAFKIGIRSLEDFEEEKLYDAVAAAFEKAGGRHP